MENIKNGFIAGGAQAIIGHPFDTIKTNIQIGKKVTGNIYKGFFPSLLNGCLLNSYLFSSKESLLKNYSPFTAGCLTGAAGSLIICPLEYVKCNRQIYGRDWKELIGKQMYRGFSTTIARDSIGYGIYFATYEWLQRKNNNPLVNGGLAGVSVWVYKYPIDTVKTRQQTSGQGIGEILRKMDWRTSFRGVHWMLARAFLVNAGIFGIFEKLK